MLSSRIRNSGVREIILSHRSPIAAQRCDNSIAISSSVISAGQVRIRAGPKAVLFPRWRRTRERAAQRPGQWNISPCAGSTSSAADDISRASKASNSAGDISESFRPAVSTSIDCNGFP